MCPAGDGGKVSVILAPLTAIMVMLVLLNLERVVVDFMAGLRPPPEGTTADAAFSWLVVLTGLNLYLVFPIVVLTYPISLFIHHQKKKNAGSSTTQ